MGGYTSILLEEIRDQNRAVLEAVGDMQQQVKYIPAIREDIRQLNANDSVFKAAIHDIRTILKNHEQRITTLEQA